MTPWEGVCQQCMCSGEVKERGLHARADGKHCGLPQGQPACSSHGQQWFGISTPRNGVGAAATQSLRHPVPLPTVCNCAPAISPPSPPQHPARGCAVAARTQPCAHAAHTLYLYKAFPGQLLPTMRKAGTTLQGGKEDRVVRADRSPPVHKDYASVKLHLHQSCTPHKVWAHRFFNWGCSTLEHRRSGQGLVIDRLHLNHLGPLLYSQQPGQEGFQQNLPTNQA